MKFHKNIRLKDYDYKTNGYYFVTVCTDFRKPYLENKKIKGIVVSELARLNNSNGIKIDFSIIMPDHIHMIIILEESKKSLPEIIGAFKSITTNVVAPLVGANKCSDLHDKVGRNKPCDYKHNFRLWQPNYYEHIIRNQKALNQIRKYMENNPLTEQLNWKELDVTAGLNMRKQNSSHSDPAKGAGKNPVVGLLQPIQDIGFAMTE